MWAANDNGDEVEAESDETVFGDLLGQFELETEREKERFGMQKLGAMLARLRPENDKPKNCPRCGKRSRVRRKGVERKLQTLSGIHTLKRNYHMCGECKLGFYPRDLLLGLPERGELSNELERRVLDFSLNEVYDLAGERWELHYGYRLSANQFRQVSKRVGQALTASDPDELQLEMFEKPERPADTVYVLVDGSMVSTREGWKETKLGMVFRDEHHVPSEPQQRGIISNARYAAHLGSAGAFKERLRAAIDAEEAHRANHVVWVADGARELWNLASTLCPDATQILDWFHAVENGTVAGGVLFGEGRKAEQLRSMWKARLETLLMCGDIDKLIRELMDCLPELKTAEQKTALNNLVRYYRNNSGRMNYKSYRERGLMIGSGPIESAHRHVIQKRMKLAGQHWETQKANEMAQMRAAYRTAGPMRMQQAVRSAYRKAKYRKPQETVPKKRMRASNR